MCASQSPIQLANAGRPAGVDAGDQHRPAAVEAGDQQRPKVCWRSPTRAGWGVVTTTVVLVTAAAWWLTVPPVSARPVAALPRVVRADRARSDRPRSVEQRQPGGHPVMPGRPRSDRVSPGEATSLGADHRPSSPRAASYQPPVLAPVIDPFRPPSTPYGPGNRGIEYSTEAGTPVVAAASGMVTFAGAVAGSLHVTVRHADGIRTSYSFLAAIRVRLGEEVAGGQVVGVAGTRLHVGARHDDVYLDPASLWDRSVAAPTVHLVALDGHDGAGGTRPDGRSGEDRRALLKLVAAARDLPLGARLARGVRLATSQLLGSVLAGAP